MSVCAPSWISTASNRPSGEKAGLVQLDGALRSTANVPVRSSHFIGAVSDSVSPAAYTRVPVVETSNCAPPEICAGPRAFNRGHRRAGHLEPLDVEWRREQGAVTKKQHVAARDVSRVIPGAGQHLPRPVRQRLRQRWTSSRYRRCLCTGEDDGFAARQHLRPTLTRFAFGQREQLFRRPAFR